jgi:hypothetical protein
MAGTNADLIIPTGRPLLIEMFEFISDCLRSKRAAKKFLLDYLDDNGGPENWEFFTAEIKSCESTTPGNDLSEAGTAARDTLNAIHYVWRFVKEDYLKPDLEASAARYFGPAFKTTGSSGRGLIVNTRWRVEVDINLIQIEADPIIARLQFLGRLPVASPSIAPSPSVQASEAPDQPSPPVQASEASAPPWPEQRPRNLPPLQWQIAGAYRDLKAQGDLNDRPTVDVLTERIRKRIGRKQLHKSSVEKARRWMRDHGLLGE